MKKPTEDLCGTAPATEADVLERLAERIKKGDQAAMSEVMYLTKGLLLKASLNVMCDYDDAKEVVSDVFNKAWVHAGKFDSEKGGYLTWLCTMTRRTSIDVWRKKSRHKRFLEEYLESSEFEIMYAPRLDQDNEAKERSRCAQELLNHPRVREKQRKCLSLNFIEGRSTVEIAEMLQEPLGTVKARIRRGLAILRKIPIDDPAFG